MKREKAGSGYRFWKYFGDGWDKEEQCRCAGRQANHTGAWKSSEQQIPQKACAGACFFELPENNVKFNQRAISLPFPRKKVETFIDYFIFSRKCVNSFIFEDVFFDGSSVSDVSQIICKNRS